MKANLFYFLKHSLISTVHYSEWDSSMVKTLGIDPQLWLTKMQNAFNFNYILLLGREKQPTNIYETKKESEFQNWVISSTLIY